MSSILNPGGGAGGGGLRETFRGVHLRTHPDPDRANNDVLLVHADEIVMHDGTSVAGWNNLVASMNTIGAGGLDAGTQGTSVWYGIHAIRKSTDGTKALLLSLAKEYFLDEQNTTDNTSSALRITTTSEKLAESFDTDVTGPVDIADLRIARVGTPTGHMWATIYAIAGGVPSGAPLATSDKIAVNNLQTTEHWARFFFRTPATLTAGTTYALAIEGDFAINGSSYVAWRRSSSNTYAAGEMFYYDGGWQVTGSSVGDFCFKVYVTRNDAAPTMPSGYDQRARIGWVYNNASQNFAPFVAQDRRVMPLALNNLSVVASSLVTLTDISQWIPPGQIATHWWVWNDAALSNNVIIPAADGYSFVNTFGRTAGTLWIYTEAASILRSAAGAVLTETQAVYLRCGAGNGTFYLAGYEW